MNFFGQIVTVTKLNFKSLPRHFWPSLVIVVGMACVVGVLLAMLSLVEGYVRSEEQAGDPGRAIIIFNGIENESASALTRDSVAIIKDAPGIRKDSDSNPMADAEVMMGTPADRKNGLNSTVVIRGFGSKGLAIRPELKIVEGRMFRPGSREMIVGIATHGQFAGMNIGDKVILPDGEWPIVGTFTTGGDILESELIADNDTLMSATRKKAYNSVLVRLASMDSLTALANALTSNPALSVIVERHSDYYKHFTAALSGTFTGIAYFVGAIMAIGAVFGALNTMYSAVSARAREIATLRAIGFGALPVAVSIVAEAMALALVGALIGAGLVWLVFNNHQTAYFNNVFNLKVPISLIGLGLAWALAVALLGGLLPSIRAARIPIVDALRAT
jgi:putative ABC transport system permease protein